MSDITYTTVAVTLFGETHEIEMYTWGDEGLRYTTHAAVVVGRFPTGTKLHRSTLTLWKREQERGGKIYTSRGATAAVINGVEYVADFTLYTHNSNRGRIVGWDRETYPEQIIAQW